MRRTRVAFSFYLPFSACLKKYFPQNCFLPRGKNKLSVGSSRMQHEFDFPLGSHGWLSLVALCLGRVGWLAAVCGGSSWPGWVGHSSSSIEVSLLLRPLAPSQPAAGQSGRKRKLLSWLGVAIWSSILFSFLRSSYRVNLMAKCVLPGNWRPSQMFLKNPPYLLNEVLAVGVALSRSLYDLDGQNTSFSLLKLW